MEQNQNIQLTADEKHSSNTSEPPDEGSDQESTSNAPNAAASNPLANNPDQTQPEHQTDMEVHHHGHVHHKKKWKEYIFQFFMLFLAVFCGFLAEYKLEQTIEHHREDEYMASMVQDLKSDTAAFRLAVNRFNNNADIIDSLFTLLKTADNSNTTETYYKGREVLLAYYRLWYNNRTFDQMKNSGNLRLIRHDDVADSITAYYQRLRYLDESRELLNQRHLAVSQYSNLVFDNYIFQKMVQRRPYKLVRYAGNPLLMPYTPQELNKYLESLTMMYGLELVQAKTIEENYLPRAERLIKLIQEKY